MNKIQLVKHIKAHIAAGDRAAEKSEQHYIAAGQHLKTLKEQHDGTWAEWEALLKERVGISTGRASELMQITDGRKTVAALRAEKNETSKIAHAKERAAASSLNSEENTPADEPATTTEKATTKKPPKVQPGMDPTRDIINDALDLVARMDGGQRAEFFDLLVEKYGKLMDTTATEAAAEAAPPKKRGRGRPPGSPNKPKPAPAPTVVTTAITDTDAPVENAPPPDIGADNMRAQIAAIDDMPDLPESLRRT
jgi:hypothetical protein